MVTTRYGCHRNYRLPSELVAEIEQFAAYNNLSESEAMRRLLCGMIRQMNARGSKLLWGSAFTLDSD
jgi:hypothetical protein